MFRNAVRTLGARAGASSVKTAVKVSPFSRSFQGATLQAVCSGARACGVGATQPQFTSREVRGCGIHTSHKASSTAEEIAAATRDYYESDSTFNFYKQVWGGEYIHVGLYNRLSEEDLKLDTLGRVAVASKLSTLEILSMCFPSDGPAPSDCTIMDMGAGTGETARVAADKYGCKVVCIDITKKQNDVNAALTKAAGLEDLVIIPGERSLFNTEWPAGTIDVVYSQDALLHCGAARHKLFEESARVLKKGGLLVLSDVMQAEDGDPDELRKVCDLFDIDGLGDVTSYTKWAKESGLERMEYVEINKNFEIHYKSILEVLLNKRETLEGVDEAFADKTTLRLQTWLRASERDLIRWGFFVFKKS